jgi:DNA-binding CsgD family transcriptional regulator
VGPPGFSPRSGNGNLVERLPAVDLMKILSKRDAVELLELISRGLACRSEDDLKKIILDLRKLVVFECAIGGYQNYREVLVTDEVATKTMLNVNFPTDFLDWYYATSRHVEDTVALEFFRTFELQNWADVTERCLLGKKDIVTLQAEEFGLRDGFCYGVRDFSLVGATIFFLAGKSVENDERTRAIIRYVIPHLSEALKRLFSERNRVKCSLTSREIEIIKWLKEGKSSWDISTILGKSESVINFHVKNIVRKLDAMNRTHAVAIAVENGLVEW